VDRDSTSTQRGEFQGAVRRDFVRGGSLAASAALLSVHKIGNPKRPQFKERIRLAPEEAIKNVGDDVVFGEEMPSRIYGFSKHEVARNMCREERTNRCLCTANQSMKTNGPMAEGTSSVRVWPRTTPAVALSLYRRFMARASQDPKKKGWCSGPTRGRVQNKWIENTSEGIAKTHSGLT